jgi:acetylornithine/succinyldiaminopimelate/putrescine aminotransferase
MTRPGFLDRVNDVGAYFRTKLDELAGKFEAIVEVRGRGLMIGVELAAEVRPVISRLCDRGIIAGPAGPNVLRFVPPLVIERDDVDRAIEALAAALGEA